jgi:23S rRNA pseudouridine1911/1915/1917 synthase
MPGADATPAADVRLTVGPRESGTRLDVFVATHLRGPSRSAVQRWIRDGFVTVNARGAKVSAPLVTDDIVAIAPPPTREADVEAEALPLKVVYQDRDIAVIEKAAGTVVHPAAGHSRGTLVNALLHHLSDLSGIGGRARPGIVHRLDKGTSGLMVIAKHDEVHRELARQFHDREVSKTYVALVWGRPRAGAVLDSPIGRDPRHRRKMSSRAPKARAALTTIVDVEPLGPLSLVTLTIGTGRTHQVRVHLSEAGFPVAGDSAYGGTRKASGPAAPAARLGRPFLHASRLAFAHPVDGRLMSFTSPLPDDLAAVVDTLRQVNAPVGHS